MKRRNNDPVDWVLVVTYAAAFAAILLDSLVWRP